VDAVGAVLHARTRVSDLDGGTEAGTFTEETRPTAEQVERLIEQATADVYMRVGGTVDDDLHDSYRHCVALRAAMLIELGFTPEQIGNTTDRTTYQSLRLDYTGAIRILVNQVTKRSFLRKVPAPPEPAPEP
jgi:hypothetical protein